MILNHQNLPANHQILQVALQAAEQQLLIYYTDCSCSQSYLILDASTKTHSEKPRVLYAARVILAVWSEHSFQQYVQLRFFYS